MNALKNLSQESTHPTSLNHTKAGVASGKRMLRNILLAVAVLFAMLGSVSASAFAAGTSYAAVQTAGNVLGNQQNAITILSYLHFGADYKGHKYVETRDVVDRYGNKIDGQFALVYRFYWEDDGVTDVAFLCMPNGTIYGSEVTYTNAIFSQPFALANLSIQLLGNAMIESNRDNMQDADVRAARELVQAVNAHGLLNLWLRLQ